VVHTRLASSSSSYMERKITHKWGERKDFVDATLAQILQELYAAIAENERLKAALEIEKIREVK